MLSSDLPNVFSSLIDLERHLPDKPLSELDPLLPRVHKMTWTDFIHSRYYREWIFAIAMGEIIPSETDISRARNLCALLPGRAGSYEWTLSEQTHCGRYLHMLTLKATVMEVSISTWHSSQKQPQKLQHLYQFLLQYLLLVLLCSF